MILKQALDIAIDNGNAICRTFPPLTMESAMRSMRIANMKKVLDALRVAETARDTGDMLDRWRAYQVLSYAVDRYDAL